MLRDGRKKKHTQIQKPKFFFFFKKKPGWRGWGVERKVTTSRFLRLFLMFFFAGNLYVRKFLYHTLHSYITSNMYIHHIGT